MSKILDWIKKHIWQTIFIGLGLFFVPLILVHMAYRIPAISPCFASTWEAGDLLGYIAGFEAFLGTMLLCILTLSQNKRANDLSERLLNIQEERDKYEMRPNLKLANVEHISKKIIDVMNENPNVFFSPDINDDDYKNEVSVIQIDLINIGNRTVDAEFQSLLIKPQSMIHIANDILITAIAPLNSKTNVQSIDKNSSFTLNFIMTPEYIWNSAPRDIELTIMLRDILGSYFKETIKFALMGKSRFFFYQPEYEIKPVD